MPQNQSSHLIHVADPMCSWCYAFGPELDRIVAETQLPVRLVMGGLFVGDDVRPLDDELRAYLRETWTRVGAMSGRPVAFDLLDEPDWTYDTERACRAVVAVRLLAPEAAVAFFDRLQVAFYAENVDLTDEAVYPGLARSVGLDDSTVAAAMSTVEVIDATRADFAEARSLGAHGFPTLLLDTGAERIVVAAGHTPAAHVIRTIRALRPRPWPRDSPEPGR